VAVGIVHVILYVDSMVMPYYTSLDAFMSSSLFGIFTSCISRREPLVVGGVVWLGAWSYGSASYLPRKRALYNDMSRYVCCAGYMACNGNYGEIQCPELCLCT